MKQNKITIMEDKLHNDFDNMPITKDSITKLVELTFHAMFEAERSNQSKASHIDLNNTMLERIVRVEEQQLRLYELVQVSIDTTNKRFEDMQHNMDKRFEAVDKHFESMQINITQRFEAVDKRFEAIERRFEAVDKRFESVDKRFESVDKRFEETNKNIKFQTTLLMVTMIFLSTMIPLAFKLLNLVS